MYKARRLEDNSFVALKVVYGLEEGLKEVALLKQAGTHPNMVRFLDCYLKNNEVHLVFEYCDMGNLD